MDEPEVERIIDTQSGARMGAADRAWRTDEHQLVLRALSGMGNMSIPASQDVPPGYECVECVPAWAGWPMGPLFGAMSLPPLDGKRSSEVATILAAWTPPLPPTLAFRPHPTTGKWTRVRRA